MRTLSRDRLLFAGLTFLVVFGSYILTLAPTLTFWDAGEFIATSYSLGIPHPPGTPLFVLMGHVFGMLPLGIGFAAKTNLMSALASSIGGFFYFLVLAQIIGLYTDLIVTIAHQYPDLDPDKPGGPAAIGDR